MDKEADDDNKVKNPEQLIEDLGGCGRYQLRMCVVAHLMKMSICWCYMSFIIVSKTPDFWCDSDVNNNVTYRETLNNTKYKALRACKSVDGTKCTQFKFDNSLRSIMSDFDLVCDYAFTASTLWSIQNAGSLVGNLVTGHVADLIGRKIPFFSSIFIVSAAEFMSLAASGWILIAVTRFTIGLAAGAFLTCIYSLLSEFTLARHRVWNIGFPSWPLETSLMCLVAWLVHDWRYINLACACIGIPFFLAWWIIPESFRWYLAHGKREQAEKVLEAIATCNNKPQVDPKRLEEIMEEEHARTDKKYSILDLFRNKQLIKVSVLLGIMWFGQAFIAYGLMFGVRTLSGNIYLNFVLINMVGIPAKAVTIWTQNRFGRRVSAMVGFVFIAICCVGVGVVQNIVSDTGLRGSWTNGLAITAQVLTAALWGPVQTMTIELFPTVVRNIGFGSMAVIGSIGTILSPQFEFLGDVQGLPGLMYFCSGAVAVASFLSIIGLAETKDVYMEDTITEARREKTVP